MNNNWPSQYIDYAELVEQAEWDQQYQLKMLADDMHYMALEETEEQMLGQSQL